MRKSPDIDFSKLLQLCALYNLDDKLCNQKPIFAEIQSLQMIRNRRISILKRSYFCAAKTDLCTPNNNPCNNSGSCERTLDGYRCVCTSNYMGEHCETLKAGIDSLNDQQSTSSSEPDAGVFIGVGVSIIASVVAFVGIVCYARKRTHARAATATSQGSVGSSMFSMQSLDSMGSLGSMASVGSVADYSVASVNPRKPGVRWTASTS